jgi:LmbE family N-acetylglucosaminyl deacetylase
LAIAQACERHLQRLKPETIYTHHRGDVNIDHVYTSEAVTIAARAQPHCSVRRILHFETASSTEWQLPSHDRAFSPNWFVNIGPYWEKKRDALAVYEREMRPFPHARSVEALDGLSTWRGASVGLDRAEAFMLVRSIEG